MSVRKSHERSVLRKPFIQGGLNIIRNMSLRNKLIGVFLLLIIMPTLVYYTIFYTYSINTKNKEIQLINQLSSQAVENTRSYFDDLFRLTQQPLYDTILMEELKTIFKLGGAMGITGSGTGNWENVLDNIDFISITNKLNSIRQYKQNINAVFLFDAYGNTVSYSLTYGQLDGEYRPEKDRWFGETLDLNGSAQVSENQPYFQSLPQLYSQKKVFIVSRAIKDYNGVDILGVFSIYIDIGVFDDICADIEYADKESIYILNDENEIVYDNHEGAESNIGENIIDIYPEWDAIETRQTKQDFNEFEENGTKYMLFSNEISNVDWKLIRIIPQDSLYGEDKAIRYNLLIVILVTTILAVVISYGVSISLTNPLKKLLQTMNTAGKGDMSVRFNVKYNDEIGKLGNGFNNMVTEIDKLINDMYITKLRKKEADLTVLQAQINPHFIYNTLETIRMMARINKDMDVYNLLFILGRLLRYSINIKNQIVTVTDEVEHLKNYIVLQNNRFDNKYELQMDIPEFMYDMHIIKLIFQPVVENAISHGLATLPGKKTITVRGEETEEGVLFFIKDNGIGIPKDQLSKLIENINDFTDDNTNSKRIGLKNVNERIKLYYGDDYGITITSEQEISTTVTFKFPKPSIMDSRKNTENKQEESHHA